MNDLREKSPKQLVAMRKQLKDELFTLKMKNAIRGLKETHTLGELRIKIARINTVLTSKTAK
jgi:ribosomal protein L29